MAETSPIKRELIATRLAALALIFVCLTLAQAQSAPLPSWNDRANKRAPDPCVRQFGWRTDARVDCGGSGVRFVGLVRHTNAEREWAYDRESHMESWTKLERSNVTQVGGSGYETGLEVIYPPQ
jgi:hypothetical protein